MLPTREPSHRACCCLRLRRGRRVLSRVARPCFMAPLLLPSLLRQKRQQQLTPLLPS